MQIHPRTWAPAALLLATALPAMADVDLSLEDNLAPPAPMSAAQAGQSVAIEGEFALIGAPGDGVRGSDAGAVHVWRKQGGVWAFEETIRPAGISAGDAFGSAVAISNGRVLVGAPGDDGFGADAGAVYAFGHGTTGWSQQQSFSGSLVGAGDAFGAAIACDGDTALIGARLDDHAGNASGTVYVMQRGVSFWGEQARLVAPDASINDQFGSSVALFGDLAVVGAPAVNRIGVNSGAAYTFQRTGNNWDGGAILPDVGTEWFDVFGTSVATDGVRIAVGAPGDDSIAVDAGGAWTFVREVNQLVNQWVLEGAYAPALLGGEAVGSSVGFAGDVLLLGAPGENYSNSEDGALRAAEWSGIAWVASGRTGIPAAEVSGGLGVSLAVDGDLALVGIPLVDNGIVDSGAAQFVRVAVDPVGTALCLGDGSGADCPCGNTGGLGEGCANSTGAGARLTASGQALVAADSLQLVVTGARANTTGMFLQGNLELGVPFRDGLLCVSHETFRLEIITLDESGAGSSQSTISLEGVIEAGDTRLYQFWYRDSVIGPCGTGSNFSGAVEVHWE